MEEPKYQLGTRAVVFLPICDHNPVAAAILAYVISFAEFYDRVNAYEPFTVDVEVDWYGVDYRANLDAYKTFGYNVSPHLFYLCPSLKDLREEVFFSFAHPRGTISDTMLWEALNLLQKKELLDYYSAIEGKNELFDYCGAIEFEKDLVYLDYHKYTNNVDAALVRWYTGTIEIVHQPHPTLNSERERKRVRNQCLRAEQAGQSSTLTVEEWLQTVTYFKGRCAFSSCHPYQVLEHFIPVGMGGGTTIYNCIPACSRCNAAKKDRHPSQVTDEIIQKAAPLIQAYLDEQHEQWLKKANEQRNPGAY